MSDIDMSFSTTLTASEGKCILPYLFFFSSTFIFIVFLLVINNFLFLGKLLSTIHVFKSEPNDILINVDMKKDVDEEMLPYQTLEWPIITKENLERYR